MKRAVLAYSGGLDTSIAIKLLKDKGFQVITVTVDVGQAEDLKEVEEKAYKIGAIEHYTIDAKEEFIKDYVFKAIKANALYEKAYPLSTALARPLIAKKVVEIAEKVGAEYIAHGCTAKGNDQLRIEISIKALNPNLKILAPIRELGWTRSQELKYAMEHGIPISNVHKRFSIDDNLWGRSIEGPELDDPFQEPPEDAFLWTVNPLKAPDRPQYVEIEFKKGVPVKINGEEYSPKEIVEKMNAIAGSHGVGRIDHIEDRVIGLKSREVYEAPAAIVFIKAHEDLEKLVLTRSELFLKGIIDMYWSKIVYEGLWFDPIREELDLIIDHMSQWVNGKVLVKLYKGNVQIVGRYSPNAIYSEEMISYEKQWFPSDAEARGFIDALGMQALLAKKVRKK